MSAARTLTSGSMFSGIGGIDLGFHRAGIETKWFCECDRYACDVLRKHWPGVPIYPDVTKLRGCDVEYVDIIHGGFPCQDISPAGKRKGLEGSRSSLYRELWRVVCEVGPDYVVMENSPGLLDLGADHVLAQMADGGYDAEWQVLSAASVGSCQRRDRLFIVGIRRGGGGFSCSRPSSVWTPDAAGGGA